jgi:hypothetical protein
LEIIIYRGMVFPNQRLVRRGRGDAPADAAAPGDSAREGSHEHAWERDGPRIITSPAGQVRRGRGDTPAVVG